MERTSQRPETTDTVTQVKLPRKWSLVGLRGQHLGTVDCCGVDLSSGRVKYLLLTTQWQVLKIPWNSVCVDDMGERFRLRPASGAGPGTGHVSSL